MNEEQTSVQAPDFSGEEMKMPETANTAATQKSESSSPVNGIIIVVLILLLLFILGGLYYWFSELTAEETVSPVTPAAVERPTPAENNEPESTTAEADVETQQALSTSDEIEAIEADLAATDIDGLDAELNAIDAELEAALSELDNL